MVAIPEAGYYCRPNLSMQRSFDSSMGVANNVNIAKIAAKNIVIEADDLLRIRAGINSLFAERKVTVAPCVCKLYMSRHSSVIDSGGTKSQDWFLFDSGVVALIYDVGHMDFTIALFDKISVRLKWCLKWSPSLTLTKPNANFHVLNTKPDSSEHVGILYENKIVADLILARMEYHFERLSRRCSVSPNLIIDCQNNKEQEEEPDTPCRKNSKSRKKSILRSLSFKHRRSFKEKEVKILDENQEPSSELSPCAEPKSKIFRKLSLRQIGRRPAVDSPVVTSESAPLSRKCLHKELTRSQSSLESSSRTKYRDSRQSPSIVRVRKNAFVFDSLANRTYSDNNDREEQRRPPSLSISTLVTAHCNPDSNVKTEETPLRNSAVEAPANDSDLDNKTEESGASRLKKMLFQRRRISRTQSLRIESQSKSSLESSDSAPSEKSLYQRPVKLLKPRSGTDSLLLHGRTVKCVIDTGHAARYAREKRRWMDTLHQCEVESTDLCVTEL